MMYELQSLIFDVMSGNDVPSVPSIKKMKDVIGSAEAMKSAQTKEAREIDDAETLAVGE